ncbi:MAG: bifunctional glycoside hydrolase 114/ polysaccharide deacetylase family protein [Burkholderiaceae bacterium]
MTSVVGAPSALTVAWHYGTNPPLEALKAFDIVVVEPGHNLDPAAHRSKTASRSDLFAYVSIGELDAGRQYKQLMPTDMLAGRNEIWDSQVVDQTHPAWPEFFANSIIAPLWAAGYRGFFLDTMDSYHLIANTPEQQQAQKAGLLKAIRLMRERFPEARLITNRGFELLDEIHAAFKTNFVAVAAESLFGRWDHANKRYQPVPPGDREWLTARLLEAQSKGISAISIDYVAPGDRDKARQIASNILDKGIMPYVTNGEINQIGVGRIEIAPRRVLMLHSGSSADGDEHYSIAQRLAKMPLHYLGYRVDLIDVRFKPLPSKPLSGEFAAVVGVFKDNVQTKATELREFYQRVLDEKIPLVFLNGFGIDNHQSLFNSPSLLQRAPDLDWPVQAIAHDPRLANYEIRYLPRRSHLSVGAPNGSRPILSIQDKRGRQRDIAAITPWGGFATIAFDTIELPGKSATRWIIDPIMFFQLAIEKGQTIPRPDLSTETGRRMLFVHIDGDGFASRAEIPGAPLAAEVMYHDFIRRYKIPHTVSVIEGETGRKGLYPQLSPTLETIARNIFKLDHVEIASHSYSHPFYWREVVSNEQKGLNPDKKPHLPIKNYHFRLKRDVDGSVEYIDRRLVPEGKRTSVFLWTGDCVPPWEAIAATQSAGLLNMNGGDTTINRQEPSLTLVAPYSIRKNGYLQVFAPNQNENVYTNNWTGPFYGFSKVIETFQLTERPRRLKPINIYYHTYSASKRSAITSLHKVYRYALKQRTTPVYSSEYIRKVIDYEDFVLARDVRPMADGSTRWHYLGSGELRTLRWERNVVNRINWGQSPGLAGRERGTDGDYLHLSGHHGTFLVQSEAATDSDAPIVRSANGRITYFSRSDNSVEFGFRSHVAGQIELEHPKACTVRSGRARLKPVARHRAEAQELVHRYEFPRAKAGRELRLSITCPR